MPKITFIQQDGSSQSFEAQVGQSVMECAIANLVDGIVAECGGSCACATCHVYVDEGWYGKLPVADGMENGMLEGACEPGPLSRLSCQLKVTEELDGLVVRVPPSQY